MKQENIDQNSIFLFLSWLTKPQSTDLYSLPEDQHVLSLPLCLPTAYPRFMPFMPLTSYNFLAGDKELRDMPVFLMVEDHGMDGRITPEM